MDLPERKNIRLRGYDYSQGGYYFVTICTKDRLKLFGNIRATTRVARTEIVGAGLVPARMAKMDVGAGLVPARKNEGRARQARMELNAIGIMVNQIWNQMADRFEIILDEYMIMPNHFHGIIVIKNIGRPPGSPVQEIVGAGLVPAQKNEERRPPGSPVQVPTLGEIVGAFKSITTTEYIKKMEEDDWPRFRGRLWHRNYYEHIIRNEKEYCLIRRYIRNNPVNWKKDKENID